MHFVLKAKYFFIMILVRRRNFFALFDLETYIASFFASILYCIAESLCPRINLVFFTLETQAGQIMQVSPSIHKERNTKNVSVGTGGLVECTTAKLHGNLFNIF